MSAAVVSLVCYQLQDRNPYGRYFSEIVDQIEERYVEKVDRDQLFESAIKGMMGKLDENSNFFGHTETEGFREALDQEFGGIGIQVSHDEKSKGLVVVATMPDTPAQKAGLLAGDKIIKVDGADIRGLSVSDASRKMRGKVGDPVKLTILRNGDDKPQELSPINRAIIEIQSVLGDTRTPDGNWNFYIADDPRIAYVRITSFGKHTERDLKAVMEQLQARGIQAMILDLRNNPGGFLETAIATCDMFIDRGTILTTRGRDNEVRDRYEATAPGTYQGFPMVVLVNRYSASASEIVAACLQDHHRAIVMGERSYGKGTVQHVIPVSGGRNDLKLTTAYYWRPSDRNIHRKPDPSQPDGRAKESEEWGVSPDKPYERRLSDEELKKLLVWRSDRDLLQLSEIKKSAAAKTPPTDAKKSDTTEKKDTEKKDTGKKSDPAETPDAAGTTTDDTPSERKTPDANPADGSVDTQLQDAIKYLQKQLDQSGTAKKAAAA